MPRRWPPRRRRPRRSSGPCLSTRSRRTAGCGSGTRPPRRRVAGSRWGDGWSRGPGMRRWCRRWSGRRTPHGSCAPPSPAVGGAGSPTPTPGPGRAALRPGPVQVSFGGAVSPHQHAGSGTARLHALPQAHRSLSHPLVTGLPLAGCGLLEALLHALGQHPVVDNLDEGGGGVAHVEEVALPAPLVIAGVPEPTSAQTGDLVVASVGPGGVGHLLPQAEDLTLVLVDEHPLVGVGPPAQALHLEAQGVLADLVTAHGHELVGRSDVPPVGGVLGEHLGHGLPVELLLAGLVDV